MMLRPARSLHAEVHRTGFTGGINACRPSVTTQVYTTVTAKVHDANTSAHDKPIIEAEVTWYHVTDQWLSCDQSAQYRAY